MPGGQDPRAHLRGPLADRLGLYQIPVHADNHKGQVPCHCWVDGCPELPPGRRAGLLLEWRRTDRGWLGRVAVTVGGTSGPAALTLWVPAEHLRPAGQSTDRPTR